jgi:hypothetical protein
VGTDCVVEVGGVGGVLVLDELVDDVTVGVGALVEVGVDADVLVGVEALVEVGVDADVLVGVEALVDVGVDAEVLVAVELLVGLVLEELLLEELLLVVPPVVPAPFSVGVANTDTVALGRHTAGSFGGWLERQARGRPRKSGTTFHTTFAPASATSTYSSAPRGP